MPTLQNIANIDISLATSGVSRTGFGTPVFIGAHRWFPERMRTYTSVTGAAVDLPAGSDELIAVTAMFSQDRTPTVVKVGRREEDLILTPDVPAQDDVYSFTITDTDGDVLNVAYTALVTDTDAEAIVDALKLLLDGDANIAAHVTSTKVGTGASATLQLSPILTTDTFHVAALVKLTDSYTATEVAATCLSAVEAVDNDFYFITTHDHTEAWVLAMAAAVEARSKLYFMSTADTATIATLAVPATDILGKITDLNYYRTVGMYHNTADTSFPECAWIGRCGPEDPGTITWANMKLAGVSAPLGAGGLVLTATEELNLSARNANFVQTVGGIDITRQGQVMGEEWIDVIRGRDLLEARITEAYQNLLINAGKIPFTDSGINMVRSVLTTVLTRYTETPSSPNILEAGDTYTIDFDLAKDVSAGDKAARTFNGSFTAYLSGAIHVVTVTGSLTYS